MRAVFGGFRDTGSKQISSGSLTDCEWTHDGNGATERAAPAATDVAVSDGAESAERWAASERELHSDKTVLI
jgi:hypothetical protein